MTPGLMSLVRPPGSNTTMWVGPEVLADKPSSGKLGEFFSFVVMKGVITQRYNIGAVLGESYTCFY